jgi:hypothetical protein
MFAQLPNVTDAEALAGERLGLGMKVVAAGGGACCGGGACA